MNAPEKPIGYWLKHLHNLLEAQFDAVLADFAVNRRQWQVLNLLSSGPKSGTEAEEALAPFWQNTTGEPAYLATVLEGPTGLTTRGWVRYNAEADRLALTAEGQAQHAAVAAHVRDIRGTVLRGLTTEQYAETIRVLSAMAANLETALADHTTA
ncbi:MarR family transcriptional regulator [Streptomyces oryzae]|uniref:MarR family transcriptional regulator n=1 Tax=Streptomyces oryzae TaxID=1434886 RepID=A0ABS3X415_9ACTN|nr:MarR family transcriptional regulator [Streptomyces oryzae]MBO8190120.1 MarR family transcriptional regulator [Streptomyces oryzae]